MVFERTVARGLVNSLPRVNSPRDFLTGYVVPVLGIYLFWLYCNKFLEMSIGYLSTMARDITIAGTQMNTSYYPMERLALIVGGVILICFLLVQNEMPTLFRGLRRREWNIISECSSSVFAILCFALSYFVVTSALELTPGAQVPFFFFGGAIVAGVLLLQDNLDEILSLSYIRSFNPRENLGAVISVGSIIVLAILTLQISFTPISQDIPFYLSAVILITVLYWGWRLSQEGMKPAVQSKRTAALGYVVFLPFIMYLLLRVLYLQHDPDPVMQNRWMVKFDFMDKVNTFKINPWPRLVEANSDARWLFLKAAIILSLIHI